MVKKVVLLVLGVVAMVGGLIAAGGGGALLAAFGSDGEIRTGTHPVSSQSRAIVSEVANFSGLSDAPSWLDRPQVLFDAQSEDDLFVGIGRAADVDAYLAGSPIAIIRDLDISPYRLDLIVRPGDSTPANPQEQTFWVASAQGTDIALNWEIRDGDYRLVIMNADASAGIETNARLGVKVPFFGPLALGVLVAGGVLFVAGVVLLLLGLRAKDRSGPPGTAAGTA